MLKAVLCRAWLTVSAAFARPPQNTGAADDLERLAVLHGSDKRDRPSYTAHYQRHFAPLRNKKLNILEIGVGGYDDNRAGGNSLRMWKDYFPHSAIHGLDIYDKSALTEARITLHKGSQFDRACLEKIYAEMGTPDIVIDDGSHHSEHVIFTFKILFPLLAEHGLYVIEDTQTSYWPFAGGDGADLRNPATLMNYFKDLADGLNYQEVPRLNYQPTLFDRTIVAVHFYHNLIVVQKGHNEERSNKAEFVARMAAESAGAARNA
ncbi:MAG TPA: hypothetical protein VHQ88_17990 [Burkholderiales bacterium]|nr:hypothetical protein [Burkholderiales bacterium]